MRQDEETRWQKNGTEALTRWMGARALWESVSGDESDVGVQAGQILNTVLLASFAIELGLKSWSKVAHSGTVGGHPHTHDLGELWTKFPNREHKRYLNKRWKGWRMSMAKSERVGPVTNVLNSIGPMFVATRYVGDSRNELEERTQNASLARIFGDPRRCWRELDACSRTFVNGFVLYDIAQMEKHGVDAHARRLRSMLVNDGWDSHALDVGVDDVRNLVTTQPPRQHSPGR